MLSGSESELMSRQGTEVTNTPDSPPVLIPSDLIAPCDTLPTVSNLNITKSSGVHIGPKFVSVTQNITQEQVVKGRILGFRHTISSRPTNKVRCSVAVFVCWAVLALLALSLYLFQVVLPKQKSLIDLDLNETWYLRRGDWQAMKAYNKNYLNLPVQYIIIGHTATTYCKSKRSCIESVMAIQQDHLQRGYDDIGPNFLVGGNGLILEGRGSNVIGSMVRTWNLKCISIMFIGDYTIDKPDELQISNVNTLIKVLVEENILDHNFTLYGQCQVQTYVVTPGRYLQQNLRHLSHWNPYNIDKCLPK